MPRNPGCISRRPLCNPDEILKAIIDFKRDSETLETLKWTVIDQAKYLKRDILLPRSYPKEERIRAFRVYAENKKMYLRVIRMISNSIRAHEKIITAARSEETKSTYGIRKVFDRFIIRIRRLLKNHDFINLWLMDAYNVILRITANAENLQRLAIA